MMPRYDYRCMDCKKIFEVTHGMNDDRGVCGNCGGELLRVFPPGTAPRSIFKGTGFHSTDYKETNYDRMNHQQKEDYEKSQADKYDANAEKEDEVYKQNLKDITGQ